MDARNIDFSSQSERTYPSSEAPVISITDIIVTLRRDWQFPLVGSLIGLTLAVLYIIFAPSLYTSSARILLDNTVSRYLQTNKIVDEPVFDDIGSQVYILSSESIVVPVVRAMNLANDGEFGGLPSSDSAGFFGSVNKLKTIVKRYIGWDDDKDAIPDPGAVRERTAVETFLKRLSVYQENGASVINVSFSSKDPNKAASIANAVSDTYIATTLEAKLKSTKMVSQWLQDRMIELKTQAMDADQALQDYKISNNLASSDKDTLNSEQLSNVNTQFTNAKIAVAEAKARVDSGATSNTEILKLRSEYRDVTARETELESSLGRGHSAVIALRKKMDELRASIKDREQLVVDTYANEYKFAKTRETELAATVAELVGKTAEGNKARVKLRELENSADTLRTIYNNFLQKFREMNTNQTEAIPVENARILTRAEPPLFKTSKKSVVVLAGSVMLGLFLGAGAALAKEWAAGVFRTPKAVEQATNIHCVVLPMVEAKRERTAWFHGGTKANLVEEFVLDAPYSRFTETLRNVKTLIDSAQLVYGVKVIGVVSSVAKEGKTTIAANLAALMVASSGARTLIIDSDVHLRNLTARLAPDAREGLIEALVDPSRLDTLVHKMRSGLDILPCVLPSRFPNASELLGSPRMEHLLTAARKSYDCIVIEIAPIMSVADIKMIERFVDRFVFVIEWGHTKRSLVQEALSEAQVIRERILGIVLNKADPVALRTIEAYKGGRFGDYYQE